MNKMEAKTIIIINDFAYVNGGASEVAINSAVALAQLDYRVIFFSSVGPVCETLERSKAEVICLDQKTITEANPIKALLQGIWNSDARREFDLLLKTLDSERTLIHIHGWTKSLSSSFFALIRKRGFKSALTLHDYFTVCPNGALYNYKKKEICSLKPMSLSCVTCQCDKQSYFHKTWRVLRQFVQSIISGIPRKVDAFIKVSEFSFNVLSKHQTFTNNHLVKNPINIDFQEAVEVSDNNLFVTIGAIDFQKGPFLFAEATQEAKVSAMMIGTGPLNDQIRSNFEDVEISGWLNREEIVKNLRKTRVLVFPSVWYETLGLVVLEAAALGIPSIVSDACAAKELIEDNVTGLLFKSGDVNDLIEKIEMLKSDSMVKRLGLEAHKRYWSRPQTVQSHIQELQKFYKTI